MELRCSIPDPIPTLRWTMATDRPKFLACRLVGHSWELPLGLLKHDFGLKMVLTCRNCTTERHDVFDTRGAITYRRYVYPAGYLLALPKGEDAPTRADYRLEYERLLQQHQPRRLIS